MVVVSGLGGKVSLKFWTTFEREARCAVVTASRFRLFVFPGPMNREVPDVWIVDARSAWCTLRL